MMNTLMVKKASSFQIGLLNIITNRRLVGVEANNFYYQEIPARNRLLTWKLRRRPNVKVWLKRVSIVVGRCEMGSFEEESQPTF